MSYKLNFRRICSLRAVGADTHRAVCSQQSAAKDNRLLLPIPVNDFHRSASQHKGWPHHDREAQLLGLAQGTGLVCAHAPGRLLDVQLGQNLVPLVTVLGIVDALGLGAPDLHIALACMWFGLKQHEDNWQDWIHIALAWM